MAKHTSGPWEVKRDSMLEWHILCKSNVPNIPGVVARVGFKPNAQLIASAPDLLEALKTMLVATDFKAPLPKGHPGHEAYLNIVAILRAKQAIAKAESKI